MASILLVGQATQKIKQSCSVRKKFKASESTPSEIKSSSNSTCLIFVKHSCGEDLPLIHLPGFYIQTLKNQSLIPN